LPQIKDEEEMMMQQAIALSLQPDEPAAPSARQDSSISFLAQETDLLHLDDSEDSASTTRVERVVNKAGESDANGVHSGTEVVEVDAGEKSPQQK
ncbi:hypothetical protein Pmar_PMAR002647, partial [Perkinsus marinus ATCC 50983]